MRRRTVEREHAGRVRFERRAFLLLPGEGERPAHDDYVIAHRIAAAKAAPELGFAIPTSGMPYPRSSLPSQLVALRARRTYPERLDSLEDRLYHAVFVRLEDVGDPRVLRRCVEAAGIPEGEVAAALADPGLRRQAFAEHAEALEHGIGGIPALLVPGREPIVGAVPLERYRSELREALAGERMAG